GGGAVSRLRLDQRGWRDGHPALYLQLLRRPVLGEAGPVAQAVVTDVRGEGDDAHTAHDRRARPADPDPAERGILLRPQNAEGADGAVALQRRVPRHWLEAVQLHAHPALHDELVQEVHARQGSGCPVDAGSVTAREEGGVPPPKPLLFARPFSLFPPLDL